MGTVFRARDSVSGEWVALKVMHKLGTPERDEHRFLREAQVLAELRHPSIVSYVAHGHTEHGQPYLAMQWLDGEDLAQTLRKRGLRLADSLALIRQVAAGLAVAHRRGIVHRDIKPSNLFLPSGEAQRATLLDFGVARRTLGRTFGARSDRLLMTQTGVVVGTPEYMAPEQARGQHDISPAADIFSLGCVLFECLTGQPPFIGEHVAAVLAKILFDEAPRLRSLRPELPPTIEPLELLLAKMLAKDPAQRPHDADGLLRGMAALESYEEVEAPQPRPIVVPESLQSGEQELVSVLYAAEPVELSQEPTLAPSQDKLQQALFQSLRTALFVHGVRAERLADGSLVATVTTNETQSAATDQAALAARSALVIHEHWPSAVIAISTGRGVVRAELPIGEAIDRAVRLLRTVPATATAQIVLDAVTAGLLDARFELAPLSAGRFALLGEHTSLDVTRPLLGKPTPCVGREQELAMLTAILTGSIEDSAARAALVLAPSGLGKSRLRHEFLRLLEQRQEPLTILYGRAEPTYSGSPYALIAQALRRFMGLDGLRTSELQRLRLQSQLADFVPASETGRLSEFLGELLNLPAVGEPSALFLGARAEPRRMADLMSGALVDLLHALCARQPVLLVLEDLQWADIPSLRISESLLRALAEQPLLMLGLARPELEERFPRLWQERGRQELRLAPLSRRASERLVQRVLGPKVPAATVARIVEQAGGNALFLEELIRAAAEGKGDQLPETVLAMLQARIGRLDTATRRVLRAASVYGDSFSTGGLRALLGHETNTASIESGLNILVSAELIEPAKQTTILGPAASLDEHFYSFRHSLLREAAYGLLTDADRKLGHHLAAAYLESQCGFDPQILAEHCERAGEHERAIKFILQATQLAINRSDIQIAEANCLRAGSWAPQGEELGKLHTLRAQLCGLRGDLAGSLEHCQAAMALLPPGSEPWCRSVALHVGAAGMSGQLGNLAELVDEFRHVSPQPEARSVFVYASSLIAFIYTYLGMREEALQTLSRAEALAGELLDEDAFAESCFFRALSTVHHFLGTDPWMSRQLLARALHAAERMQLPRNIINDGMELALRDALLGNHTDSETRMRALYERARQLGEPVVMLGAGTCLATVLALTGQSAKLDEAQSIAAALQPQLGDHIVMGALLQSMRGVILYLHGELDRARAELIAAAEQFIIMPGLRAIPLAFLLQVVCHQKDAAAAKRAAAEAEDLLSMIGHAGSFEPMLLLGIAEGLMLAGEREQAHQALQSARAALDAAANCISDEKARKDYLEQMPLHARIIALTQRWLQDASQPGPETASSAVS